MALLDDLVAAVQAGGVSRVYKINEVPPGAGYPYAVVGLSSPDKIARTGDGAAGDLDRASAQFFGRDIDGVLDIANKGDLDGARISGRVVSRDLSSGLYRDPDDSGVLAITHAYRL
jgi:hypothetical protein